MSSESKGPAQEIDPRIKDYIDEACQATITTLIDKQAESQKHWNEQIQKAIDDRFSKLEQVSLINNEMNSRESLTSEEQNNQATPAIVNSPLKTRDDQAAGCTRVHKPNSS
ncbi:7548_t:CDS:2 [Gigaspora rosea]|nr:7548_t:CDS:2 [Gigaspora rosea]